MDIITTTAELGAACSKLSGAEMVTVDTEFMRETTYWPKLCVIQLAGPDDAFVVDALAPGLDLAPFFQLMANEAVLKVFHSGRQDIEIVWHRGGLIPHPVFDTQIAAMVCGFGDSISYEQLVQRVTGARIDKSSRFTDWARRPLSERQLAYAVEDVTHLRGVYARLADELKTHGRSEWLETEMDILTSVETYQVEPEKAWMRLKMRARRPVELQLAKELAAWREREAQRRDVPRGRILKDDALFEIAAQQPATEEAMSAMRSLGQGFSRSRSGEEILGIVQRVLEIPRDQLPKLPRVRNTGDINTAAVDLLKVLLKMMSEVHGVAPKLIANVDDLEAIALDDDADVPALQGWRRRLFGDTALKLKHGEVALKLDGRKVLLVNSDGTAVAEAAE
ncbi:MAG: ribonuclease D [Bauldia sp.]